MFHVIKVHRTRQLNTQIGQKIQRRNVRQICNQGQPKTSFQNGCDEKWTGIIIHDRHENIHEILSLTFSFSDRFWELNNLINGVSRYRPTLVDRKANNPLWLEWYWPWHRRWHIQVTIGFVMIEFHAGSQDRTQPCNGFKEPQDVHPCKMRRLFGWPKCLDNEGRISTLLSIEFYYRLIFSSECFITIIYFLAFAYLHLLSN